MLGLGPIASWAASNACSNVPFALSRFAAGDTSFATDSCDIVAPLSTSPKPQLPSAFRSFVPGVVDGLSKTKSRLSLFFAETFASGRSFRPCYDDVKFDRRDADLAVRRPVFDRHLVAAGQLFAVGPSLWTSSLSSLTV